MASRQHALQWRKLARGGSLRGRSARFVAATVLWLALAFGCCLAVLLPVSMLLGVAAAVLLPSFLRCIQLRHFHWRASAAKGVVVAWMTLQRGGNDQKSFLHNMGHVAFHLAMLVNFVVA